MPDYATQRANMVESQVRTNDVTDVRILNAMREVPRELLVPADQRPLAYADIVIQLGNGRFLLDPRTFAKLAQLAEIAPTDRLLDVGCSTGYSTAVLSRLSERVTGLEEDSELAQSASRLLQSDAAAKIVRGALVDGYATGAPYDVVLINGAIETEPEQLLSQLGEDGRLVTVVRNGKRSRAFLYVREHGAFGRRPAFDAYVPVLPGFARAKAFVL